MTKLILKMAYQVINVTRECEDVLPTAQGPRPNRVTSPDNHTGFREWAGHGHGTRWSVGGDRDTEGGVVRR